MPKKKTAGQRKKSYENVKRQAGSIKVWQNQNTGAVWESVRVHNGRVTRLVRGPEALRLDIAHEMLTHALKDGVG